MLEFFAWERRVGRLVNTEGSLGGPRGGRAASGGRLGPSAAVSGRNDPVEPPEIVGDQRDGEADRVARLAEIRQPPQAIDALERAEHLLDQPAARREGMVAGNLLRGKRPVALPAPHDPVGKDRKSTRLNSSHA